MEPRVRKHGRDAGELQRVAQELPTRAQGIAPASLCWGGPEERPGLAAVDNLGRQQLSISQDLLLAPELFEEHFERVPGPQVRGEGEIPLPIRNLSENLGR